MEIYDQKNSSFTYINRVRIVSGAWCTSAAGEVVNTLQLTPHEGDWEY